MLSEQEKKERKKMANKEYYQKNKIRLREVARRYELKHRYEQGDWDHPANKYTHVSCNQHFDTAVQAYVHLREGKCFDLLRNVF